MRGTNAGLMLRLWLISLAGLAASLIVLCRMTGEFSVIVALVLGLIVGLIFLGLPLLFWVLLRGGRSVSTPEQIEARRREVQGLLERRIASEEELRVLVDADNGTKDPVSNEVTARRVMAWAREKNAELWFYSTSAERWENLCGECGVALVRDGNVIDFEMWAMN